MRKTRRTKIVATLGPATETKETIKDLINAGVNIFRLNASHGTLDWHLERIKIIKLLRTEIKKPVAILFDLQGPKIRVGKLKDGGPVVLGDGNEIVIDPDCVEGTSECISTNYPNLANDVEAGDLILLDDGIMNLTVISKQGQRIKTKIIAGGILSEHKGVNIPGTTGSLSAISEKDEEGIKFAVDNDIDYLALSFVRTSQDIIKLKEHINKYNGDIEVIAKIEKPQALENIQDIVDVSDGIMVARGDLGIELAPQKVPIAQKKLITLSNENTKFVITATQMLESMVHNPIPSRAEASDVANAILDGTDAIMLSAETSVGKYPIRAVSMMVKIAEEVEKDKNICIKQVVPKIQGEVSRDSHAIALSAVEMSKDLDPAAIVVFTNSGFSAKLISKFRPNVPVIAVTHQEKVSYELNAFWGVYPYVMDIDTFDEEILSNINDLLREQTGLSAGDNIILIGGMPYLISGITNFMRIHKIS
jgi:pyruvate kinase